MSKTPQEQNVDWYNKQVEIPLKFMKADGTITDTIPTSGSGGGGVAGVETFNGRDGAVIPGGGDYTAAMVGADPAGSAAAVQTNLDQEIIDVENLAQQGLDLGNAHVATRVTDTDGEHGVRYIGGQDGSGNFQINFSNTGTPNWVNVPSAANTTTILYNAVAAAGFTGTEQQFIEALANLTVT